MLRGSQMIRPTQSVSLNISPTLPSWPSLKSSELQWALVPDSCLCSDSVVKGVVRLDLGEILQCGEFCGRQG